MHTRRRRKKESNKGGERVVLSSKMPQATVNKTGQISANVEGIGNLAEAASRMGDANWDELRRNRGGTASRAVAPTTP